MITLSASKAREQWADLLNRVIYERKQAILTRHGQPVAVILPLKALDSIEYLEQALAEARAGLALARGEEGESYTLEEVRERLSKQ